MITPDQIDIRRQLCDSFGKAEVEFMAMAVVEFCQLRRQGWVPFSLKQIRDFIRPKDLREKYFHRLVEAGHILETTNGYEIQQSFVDRCFRASLVVKDSTADGKTIWSCDRFVGLVSQSPNDPAVMDPGKWHASVLTADRSLIGLGVFDNRTEALKAALDGLVKNWSYAEWHTYWQAADEAAKS